MSARSDLHSERRPIEGEARARVDKSIDRPMSVDTV
jgi:hypothetical protein